MQAAAES